MQMKSLMICFREVCLLSINFFLIKFGSRLEWMGPAQAQKHVLWWHDELDFSWTRDYNFSFSILELDSMLVTCFPCIPTVSNSVEIFMFRVLLIMCSFVLECDVNHAASLAITCFRSSCPIVWDMAFYKKLNNGCKFNWLFHTYMKILRCGLGEIIHG